MVRLRRIFHKLIVSLFPKSSIASILHSINILQQLRFKGSDIWIHNTTLITRKGGLDLGNKVVLTENCNIDATAGVMLGDKTIVKQGIIIKTQNLVGSISPVIIGSGNIVDTNVNPGSIWGNKTIVKGLSKYQGQLVFSVSTGRSGSNAISKLIDQHPNAVCYHDSFPHIYRYASDRLYKQKSDLELEEDLYALYNSCDMCKGTVHGQSDQKIVCNNTDSCKNVSYR